MEEKKFDTLYEKYKTMFTVDPRRPARMFGFECNIGWYDILDRLMSHIAHHLKYGGKAIAEDFKITQIKEKFGGLRFYYDGGDDVIRGMVSLTEGISYDTCEYCGSNQEVIRSTGWIVTACKPCIGKNERLQNQNWGDKWKPIELSTNDKT